MTITYTTRNATLGDMVAMLKDQQGRKLDIVAPAEQLHFQGGILRVRGTEVVISEDGVTQADGMYVPTSVFDEHLSKQLAIPLPYVRRMRAERVDLYDANANGLLHGRRRTAGGMTEVVYPGDSRSWMLRLFKGEGGTGVARSMHSNKFGRIDYLDVLAAAGAGIAEAGVEVSFDRCDLTERRMYVQVTCPDIAVHAPALLGNYRSPFSGQSGKDVPIVWAGFLIQNSEVGFGAASITPRIVFEVCKNGATIAKDATRAVHLGARMDDGLVEWSADTQRKQLALITARARDAVKTFLNADYVSKVIREMEAKAGIELNEPAEDIKKIGSALSMGEDTIDGILRQFIKGGDITVGGVMHAVTAHAQTVQDADLAYQLEAMSLQVLEAGARVLR